MPKRRRSPIVIGVFLAAAFGPAPGAHATPDITAGSCLVSIEATWVAATEEVLLDEVAGGTCATVDGIGEPEIGGGFSAISGLAPIDCTNAIADGGLELGIMLPGNNGIGPFLMDLVVVKAGDVVTMTFASGDLRVAGTAQLVQSPTTTTACEEGTNPVTWTGVLTFEDPVLSE